MTELSGAVEPRYYWHQWTQVPSSHISDITVVVNRV